MLDRKKYVEPFTYVHHYESDDGYIVWRLGTGNNCELLHLKSLKEGGATKLLKVMLKELKKNPPYATVFGFTLSSNDKARAFYRNAGFTLSGVNGIYADGVAVVFSANFNDLCQRHLETSDHA